MASTLTALGENLGQVWASDTCTVGSPFNRCSLAADTHACTDYLKHDSNLYLQVMQLLESRGVTLRVASEKLIAEEAPESYKDVSQVGQPAATVEKRDHC